MARQDDGLGGQFGQHIGETTHQIRITAALEVSAADTHAEQGVASEGGMLVGTVENDASGRVAWRL